MKTLLLLTTESMPVSQEVIYAAFVSLAGVIVTMAGAFAAIGRLLWKELKRERDKSIRYRLAYSELKNDFESYKQKNPKA